MPSHSLSIAQLVDSGARLSWQESVALVKSLAVLASSGSPGVPSSGTFEEFTITESGEVAASIPLPQLSISELALLLTRLLPADARSSQPQTAAPAVDRRPPAGVHLVIARALGLAPAPTFADMEEFCAALARFLRQESTVLLRAVYERSTATADEANVAVANVTAAGSRSARRDGEADTQLSARPAAHQPAERIVERRRSGPRTEVLRRMLRDEDRQNYLYLVEQQNRAEVNKRRTTSPAPETLRRLLREADEHNFALRKAIEQLMASGAIGQTWRRRLGRLAVGVALVAGIGGVIELEHRRPASVRVESTAPAPGAVEMAAAPPPVSITSNDSTPSATGASTGDAGAVEHARPASPKQRVTPRARARTSDMKAWTPKTAAGGGALASRSPVAHPTAPQLPATVTSISVEHGQQRATPPRRSGGADHNAQTARPADTSHRPTYYDITSGRKAPAHGGPSTEASALSAENDEPVAKRQGPVPRFFAAVYRRLGRLVHGEPRARSGTE